MRKLSAAIFMMCAALLVANSTNFAQEKKSEDVVLKGTITCAKCDLGVEKKCATVIVVKMKDKDVTYYFDKGSNKKYHGDTCTAAKKGTVEGTVSVVDDGTSKKSVVMVKSLKYD
jgi:Family of unknown function (DUF6370)